MIRWSHFAACAAFLVSCSSGPSLRPQTCQDDSDCASDAHCRDTACIADATPQARITGPSSALAHAEAVFDGSGSSDPDDDIVAYTWSVRLRSGDCAPDLGPGGGSTFRPTFTCPGEFDVILVVRDRTGVISEPAIQPVAVTAP